MNKKNMFLKLLQEEPLTIEQYADLLACSNTVNGVSISKDTVYVCDLSEFPQTRFNAIVVDLDGVPKRTVRTTHELLDEFSQHSLVSYQVIKKSVLAVLKMRIYKFPYLDLETLFMTLDGSAKRNTSIINLTLLDNVLTYSHNMSLLTFCNDLELILPISLRALLRRIEVAARCYFVFYHHELAPRAQLCEIHFIDHWRGHWFKQANTHFSEYYRDVDFKSFYLERFLAQGYEQIKDLAEITSYREYLSVLEN